MSSATSPACGACCFPNATFATWICRRILIRIQVALYWRRELEDLRDDFGRLSGRADRRCGPAATASPSITKTALPFANSIAPAAVSPGSSRHPRFICYCARQRPSAGRAHRAAAGIPATGAAGSRPARTRPEPGRAGGNVLRAAAAGPAADPGARRDAGSWMTTCSSGCDGSRAMSHVRAIRCRRWSMRFSPRVPKLRPAICPRASTDGALVESVRRNHAEGVIFCAPSFCDPALLEQPMLVTQARPRRHSSHAIQILRGHRPVRRHPRAGRHVLRFHSPVE